MGSLKQAYSREKSAKGQTRTNSVEKAKGWKGSHDNLQSGIVEQLTENLRIDFGQLSSLRSRQSLEQRCLIDADNAELLLPRGGTADERNIGFR